MATALFYFQQTKDQGPGNPVQIPASSLTLDLYRPGSIVKVGGSFGVGNGTISVYDVGDLQVGDSVSRFDSSLTAVGTVQSVTNQQTVVVNFSSAITLSTGDRIVPTNNRPDFFLSPRAGSTEQGCILGVRNSQGQATTSDRGIVQAWVNRRDTWLVTSGGGTNWAGYAGWPMAVPFTESQSKIVDGVFYQYSVAGINQALLDLGATGGEVYVVAGQINIGNTEQIKIPSKCSLRGAGMGATIFKLANNSGVSTIGIENSDTTNGNAFLTLRDFSFDGNVSNQAMGESVAIHLKRVSDVLIEGVEVGSCRADGIYLEGVTSASKRVQIRRCYIHDVNVKVTSNGHAGIYVNTSSAGVNEVVLVDNILENIGAGQVSTGISMAAIAISGANNGDVIVSRNTANYCWGNGILVQTTASRILIDHNDLVNCGQQNATNGGNGIIVDTTSTGRIVLDHNVIDGVPVNSDNGIEISGTGQTEVVIDGNLVRNVMNSNKGGIDIGGWNSVLCSGNTVTGCAGVGIQAQSAGPTSNEEYIFDGNMCQGNGLGGINVRGKGNLVVKGNICNDQSSGFGIQIGEGITVSGAEAFNVVVEGNVCARNLGVSTGDGIRVQGEIVAPTGNLARRVVLKGNICQGNALNGMRVQDIQGGILAGNLIQGNSGDGIGFLGAITDLLITGNEILDHTGGGKFGINASTATLTRVNLANDNHFQNNTTNTSALLGIPAFPNLATTPSVAGGHRFRATNSAATTITNFTGGYEGQEFTLYSSNSVTTIQNNATIRLDGGANITLTSADVIRFQLINGVWYQSAKLSANT